MISQGNSTKKLTLHPPVKLIYGHNIPLWVGTTDNNKEIVSDILTLE